MKQEPSLIAVIRQRPGMYVGGTGSDGALHLVYEVLGNALDQHLLGCCTAAHVELAADGTITVTDDGPGFRLTWSTTGEDAAAHGLAGWVAARAQCAVADVARSRWTGDTAKGPIVVEVALVWRGGFDGGAPAIESFVNLDRTREGSHVEGLIDGMCEFTGSRDRARAVDGLKACVSIVLADVIYGSPTRNRLDTPEAREPVANTTVAALDVWAVQHPARATTLCAHTQARPR